MIQLLLTLTAVALALPALSLLVLTLAALRQRHQTDRPLTAPPAPRVAVLVPAHNESANLLPTLACLRQQLGPRDRLMVIADNCQDDSAALARAAGAEVVERQDATLRGKGYALAYGVDQLRSDPPDVVLVVDADCTLSEGALERIARRCQAQ